MVCWEFPRSNCKPQMASKLKRTTNESNPPDNACLVFPPPKQTGVPIEQNFAVSHALTMISKMCFESIFVPYDPFFAVYKCLESAFSQLLQAFIQNQRGYILPLHRPINKSQKMSANPAPQLTEPESLESSTILLPPSGGEASPSADGGRASKSSFGYESTMSLLVDSLKDRLLFAIPKKGRLHEKCLELLAGADIKYNRAHRLDVALVQNMPIALYVLCSSIA